MRAGVSPDRPRSLDDLDDTTLMSARASSGLADTWSAIVRELESVARLDGHLVFLSDRTGMLLWYAGTTSARSAAERVNLVPGARWDENAAGTNGVGTVLTLGRPFQVRGREHYLRPVTGFTCSAAPIRDQSTGRVLGVLDVTTPAREANALTLTVVAQAARLAEAQLRDAQLNNDLRHLARFADRAAWHTDRYVALVSADGRVLRAAPPGWLYRIDPPVTAGHRTTRDGQRVEIEALGPDGPYAVVAVSPTPAALSVSIRDRTRARVTIGDSQRQLGERHTELLRALLRNPDGLSAAELARIVYGDAGKVSTVRGEITRMRRILGNRLQASPYRVTGQLDSDLRP